MSGKNTVKCRYCKKEIIKDEAVKIGRASYYHPDCLEEKEREEQKKLQESKDYKELIDYICELYNLDAPSGMILKQIKEYREEYGLKLQGIRLSLQYFYETKENPIMNDVGIGIVPFVYDEAKKYYMLKKEVEKSLDDYKVLEPKIIEVDSPKNIKPKKNKSYIDILSL